MTGFLAVNLFLHRMVSTLGGRTLALASLLVLLVTAACGPPRLAKPLTTDCLASLVGSTGTIPFVVITSGQRVNELCKAPEPLKFIACLTKVDGPLADPGTRDKMMDCIKGSRPDASVAGGYASGFGTMFVQPTSYRPAGLPTSCHSGPGVDPRLTSGPGSTAGGAASELTKAFVVIGPYSEIYANWMKLEYDYKLGLADDPTAEPSNELKEAREHFRQATEAVVISDQIPDGVSLGDAFQYLLDTAIEWLTPDPDEPAPAEDEGGRPAPGLGDSSACEAGASFLAQCEAARWGTEPCKLFRDKISNPTCDPRVVMTDGDRACKKQTFSPEQLSAAVKGAELRCYELVNPTPDGDDVCSVVLAGVVGYWRDPKDLCGDPAAMPGAEQCALKPADPRDVLDALIGNKVNALNVFVQPKPKPGPGGPGPR